MLTSVVRVLSPNKVAVTQSKWGNSMILPWWSLPTSNLNETIILQTNWCTTATSFGSSGACIGSVSKYWTRIGTTCWNNKQRNTWTTLTHSMRDQHCLCVSYAVPWTLVSLLKLATLQLMLGCNKYTLVCTGQWHVWYDTREIRKVQFFANFEYFPQVLTPIYPYPQKEKAPKIISIICQNKMVYKNLTSKHLNW